MDDANPCAESRSRLRQWLLGPAVQLGGGAQRGGVAGLIDAEGRPQYVYAEISGYYLHWLASARPAGASARAQAALEWLRRHYAEAAPATRVYLVDGAAPDWRNRCSFLFDLGMVVGGIAAAARSGLCALPAQLLDRLYAIAAGFVAADGALLAVRGDAGEDRWSTRAGPFLAKPAARLLAAGRAHPLPAVLHAACVDALRRYAPVAQMPGHAELHPALYHLEGSACARPAPWDAIAATLATLLRLDDGSGRLPEIGGKELRRLDVTAQALRVALLLRDQGHAAPEDPVLARLAAALAAAVDTAGGVAFRSDRPGAERNVWCAMFAEQALDWYARWHARRWLDATADDLV